MNARVCRTIMGKGGKIKQQGGSSVKAIQLPYLLQLEGVVE